MVQFVRYEPVYMCPMKLTIQMTLSDLVGRCVYVKPA